jgi:3-isopropylmalate/(R)-2-methylmalate dehydratase small subunit
MKFGIRCVIAPSFGEIFEENCFQNGLLPVRLAAADCAALAAALEGLAEPTLTVDLERGLIVRPDGGTMPFAVPAERRAALLGGLDEIDVILGAIDDIEQFQRADRAARPWVYRPSA